MPFTPASVSDAMMMNALVGTMQEYTARCFGGDEVHGDDANGRPIKFRGVGQRAPFLQHPPRITDAATISQADRDKMINYTLAWARTFVAAFEAKGLTGHGVTLSNIAAGASAQVELTAIRGEIAAIRTFWNTQSTKDTLSGETPAPAIWSDLPEPLAVA